MSLRESPDTRCLLLSSAGQLDPLVYGPMARDVPFDMLAQPVLRQRLRLAGERVALSLARAESGNAA